MRQKTLISPFRLMSAIAILLIGLSTITAGATDIVFFGATKGRSFIQTTTGAPILETNAYSFYAFIADRSASSSLVLTASVTSPSGTVVLQPNAPGESIDNDAGAAFTTSAALDAAYPNGNYTFNFTSESDGSSSSTLDLAGNSYPGAPHISNFTEAQLLDPGADFVLKWDSFIGGTSNDLVQVSIYSGTSLAFETSFPPGGYAALGGRATALLIPAYALQPLTSYRAYVRFRKQVMLERDDSTSRLGFTGYESTTRFDFQTRELRRSPSDIFPIAVTGLNEIAYDMAFGSGNYLVAMIGRQNPTRKSDHGEIVAVLVDRNGNRLQTISTEHEGSSLDVAFGTTTFLIVWDGQDDLGIYGQIVRADGSVIGGPFAISSSSSEVEQPDVAFDGANFLVVWTARDNRGEYTLPRGQLVSPDGALIGGEIALADFAVGVEVAAGAGRFLVIATDSDTESEVYGQLVAGDGDLIGSPIAIDLSPTRSEGPKKVFFDPTAQHFVVTFMEGANEESFDLFARTVELNGAVGPRKTIASGPGFQGAASIASDGHLLLITWLNGIFSPTVTSKARFFDSTLNPVGAELTLFVQHSNNVPFIAQVQFDGSRYLIVNSALQIFPEEDDEGHDFANGDTYGRFIQPSTPGILTQPRGQTVALGSTATFLVEASGPPPLSYQWQRNAVNIADATSPILQLNNVSFADFGLYRVVVSNSFGAVTSELAQLFALQRPSILQQPQSRLSVNLGDSVTFNVVASGGPPLAYQWRLNGISILGATNATLTVPAEVGSQGSYSVTVANPVGATNSAEASLTLQGPVLDFRDSFAARNILEDSTDGFGGGSSVGATKEPGEPNHAGKPGGASVWYGWRAPGDGTVTFSTTGSGFDTLLAVYTGTNVAQLTPVISDDDGAGFFASTVTFNVVAGREYVLAVDGVGAQTGRIFLAWNFTGGGPRAPVIVTPPLGQTVVAGSSVSLEVVVASSTTPEFQWFKDGEPLEGETRSILTIPSFQRENVGTYLVRVRNQSDFEVFSPRAVVEIATTPAIATDDKFEDALLRRIVIGLPSPLKDIAAPAAGRLTTHNFGSTKQSREPNHAGVIGGASRWFALRTGASGVLAVDTVGSDFDTVLAVYTGASLEMPQRVAQDNDGAPDGVRSRVRFEAQAEVNYSVAVDGVNGAQGNIVLNYAFGSPPQILEAPINASAIGGSDIRLRVVAASDSVLSYLWRFNGAPIRGATNAELLVANCQPLDQGTYTIEVSNALGTAARAANIAVLSANTKPTVSLLSPSAGAVYVLPTNVTFSAQALAAGVVKVEYFQGARKIGEATSAPYTVAWTPPKSGPYTFKAKVTDAQRRSAFSTPVRIAVVQPVTITTPPASRELAIGKAATFSVKAIGTAPLRYQWLFNGTPITGATKRSFTIKRVQPENAGMYSVGVSNAAGRVESAPAVLSLVP